MAAKGMVVQASRFALLKIDDDDDVDESGNNSKLKTKPTEQVTTAKKRNKKKKKDNQQVNDAELRNLAFGKTSGKKSSHDSSHAPPQASTKQWEEWQKLDSEQVTETYEKDLQQALLQSKLEFEERQQVMSALGVNGDASSLAKEGKKKKKKDKTNNKMSLDEFQQCDSVEDAVSRLNSDPAEVNHHSEGPDMMPAGAPVNSDPRYFKKVDQEVNKILQKEKIQAEYEKQYLVENARKQQYDEDISKRDEEIDRLKTENEQLQNDLKAVKKRNKQLCFILGQGEMKDKTQVLLELDELKSVRDELTEEVNQLRADLEKERSRVHALKADLEKQENRKGGKHAK